MVLKCIVLNTAFWDVKLDFVASASNFILILMFKRWEDDLKWTKFYINDNDAPAYLYCLRWKQLWEGEVKMSPKSLSTLSYTSTLFTLSGEKTVLSVKNHNVCVKWW